MRIAIAAALAACTLSGAARAAVSDQWDTGFTTRNVVTVTATKARAYAALGEIGRWWSNDHTYSHSASNMTLVLKPGGCFCEALPGGGIQHGTVIVAWPEQGLLRLSAALGPAQELGVSGVLTFQIKDIGGGKVEVTQTYTIGGGRPGFAKGAAAAVDGVVGEQLRRYASYVEEKRVEPKPASQGQKVPPADPRARLRRNERG
jgi:hypothetical protein